jgi:hypothetical protein
MTDFGAGERRNAFGWLFHAVVGGFAGDDYVVDVAFAEAGSGDAHEMGFFG